MKNAEGEKPQPLDLYNLFLLIVSCAQYTLLFYSFPKNLMFLCRGRSYCRRAKVFRDIEGLV